MFTFRKNGHFYEKIGKKGESICIDDEIPFEIPDSWEYCKLSSIGNIVGGGTPKTQINEYWENGDIPWLTPADMKYVKGKYVSQGARNITKLGLDKSSAQLIPKNSIIYSSRAPIGHISISNNELSTNQGFKSFVPINLDIVDYMYYCLISFTDEIKSRASGTTFKEISKSKFGETIIPIPPINEQKRIVKKIEEILPFITEYHKYQERLDKLNSEFPDKLKSSILQDAIQGKLVPQDSNDEPASILLEKLQEEKERLIKEKKIKRNKKESYIIKEKNHFYEKIGKEVLCIDEELLFQIPKSWNWVRLGDIVYNFGQKKPDKTFSYIDVGSIDNKNLKLNQSENILTKDKAPSRARKIVKEGSIIYSTVRPYLLNMCIIDKKFSHEPIASTAFAILNPFKGLNNKYLFYYLQTPTFINYVNKVMSGVAYPAINDKKLYNALITLPPLEEQKRIVEKIDALFEELNS